MYKFLVHNKSGGFPMKKFVSILMVLCMLTAVATMAVSATDAVTSAPVAEYTDAPDWIITEINPDQQGDGTGGWSDGKDVFEFFELYNNSGKTLNLYDYAMFYNGYGRTNADLRFENVIVEYTPFNGPDWRDGTYTADKWTDTSYAFAGEENLPMNPVTCDVAPGEVVVIWSMFNEVAYANWNDGKGMSIADFRTYWNIPENVKVICWDGNSTVKKAGNDKNFNIKNSETGTYGICQKSEAIAMCNVNHPDGADDATKDQYRYFINFSQCAEISNWATVDMAAMGGHVTNGSLSYNFCLDAQKYGAAEWAMTYDSRRGMVVETHAEATPGALTPLQKMILGVDLAAGDKVEVEFCYAPYVPEEGDFLGLEINGKLYGPKDTFTADAAGKYTVKYVYGKEEVTTTPAPDTTPAPVEDETTPAPVEDETTPAEQTPTETTPAPTTPAETTPAPAPAKKGCGSVVAMSVLACLIPAGVVICKKRK